MDGLRPHLPGGALPRTPEYSQGERDGNVYREIIQTLELIRPKQALALNTLAAFLDFIL